MKKEVTILFSVYINLIFALVFANRKQNVNSIEFSTYKNMSRKHE